jgi:protein-tyrosine phosphatase
MEFEYFEPSPKTDIHHLIWNIIITDKLTSFTPDMIVQNKIKHILAILPHKKDFLELNQEITQFPYDVLEYGDDHDMNIDFVLYDTYCKKIDAIAKNDDKIRNVLVFCNNGYQRSMTFLVYYLVNYHSDEFPTIEKATGMILSQVDRDNYTKTKDGMIENITKLLGTRIIEV